uniref:Nucleosome assembly protein 1 n=1 Tax=Taenia asiatica TaxID=60517 RepID=A0A0R3WD22_TAEAS
LFKKRASIYSEYLKELYALEFKYARLYAPIYLQLSGSSANAYAVFTVYTETLASCIIFEVDSCVRLDVCGDVIADFTRLIRKIDFSTTTWFLVHGMTMTSEIGSHHDTIATAVFCCYASVCASIYAPPLSDHVVNWHFIALGFKQRAIVTGKNMEEVEEDEPSANQKTLGDAEPDASLGSAFGIGIPGYWAKVLKSAPLMRNCLTEMDLEILQYLEGIRYSFSKKLSSPGFRLVFMFKQNPFFNDNVLMKQFSLKFIDQCEDLNEFGPTKVISTKASQIDWTSGHEPTGDVVVPPKDSFFNLFRDLQPESPDTPEYAQLMEDYDICVYIRDRVLPYAVYWFTGEMMQA